MFFVVGDHCSFLLIDFLAHRLLPSLIQAMMYSLPHATLIQVAHTQLEVWPCTVTHTTKSKTHNSDTQHLNVESTCAQGAKLCVSVCDWFSSRNGGGLGESRCVYMYDDGSFVSLNSSFMHSYGMTQAAELQ